MICKCVITHLFPKPVSVCPLLLYELVRRSADRCKSFPVRCSALRAASLLKPSPCRACTSDSRGFGAVPRAKESGDMRAGLIVRGTEPPSMLLLLMILTSAAVITSFCPLRFVLVHHRAPNTTDVTSKPNPTSTANTMSTMDSAESPDLFKIEYATQCHERERWKGRDGEERNRTRCWRTTGRPPGRSRSPGTWTPG